MKSWLSLIIAVILWWLPLGWAQAANLKYVRAGEHGSFTRVVRVVFEFQGMVRSTAPTIIGRGKFYVIFFDMTTALPRQTLNKITKGIQFVELIQEESRLTANITLSFPYFKLKTFSLSNPDRFVIDAYRMSSPPKTSELEESLQAEPLNAEPDTEEPLQTMQLDGTLRKQRKAQACFITEEQPSLSLQMFTLHQRTRLLFF